MIQIATFTASNGEKLKVCVPIKYSFTFNEDDTELNYGIVRGINLVNTDGISALDTELNKIGQISNYGGIESINFEDKDTPFGYKPAYFLDLTYQVIDKGIIKSTASLRNNAQVKDFWTKNEAEDFLKLQVQYTQSQPVVNSQPVTYAEENIQTLNNGNSFTVSEKALIALPPWSAYKSNSPSTNSCNMLAAPMKYTFSKGGETVFQTETGWDIPSHYPCFDNHNIEAYIPMPFGDYQLDITNNAPESLVAGFIRIDENRYAYAMYHKNGGNPTVGLDKATIYREIKPNTREILPYSIIKDRDYFNMGNQSHVQVLVSLIIKGKIYAGKQEISWNGGGSYNTYYGMYPKVGEIYNCRLKAKDSDAWVDLEINAANRTIKLVNSKNATISEKHSFISVRCSFENNIFNGGNPHYKHDHKMFNNKGNLNTDETGIHIINQDWKS